MSTPVARIEELLQRAGLGGVSRPALLGVFLVAALAIIFGAWRAMPRDEKTLVIEHGLTPESGDVGARESSDRSIQGSAAPTPDVCVHVVGAVHRPGVYSLCVGSRVDDAVAAAGGLLGNAAEQAVNMARPLVDGEQIAVLTIDEYEQRGADLHPGGLDSTDAVPGKVDLNGADISLLETLPGIGPTTAQRIVDDREENGPFSAAEDLMRVSGIGAKKFEAVADLITVR